MDLHIFTLFPEMIRGPLDYSIIKRAQEMGRLNLAVHDIRQFTHDRHHTADDYQFGGGPGMVMKAEPIFEAVESVLMNLTQLETARTRVILTSPQGRVMTQELVRELAGQSHILIICGHYEGVDERVREGLITDDISIGDYVLTGGEIPALVIADAVARLQPGVVGSRENLYSDSITSGLLQHPVYTRPVEFRDMKAPDILLSGNHQAVEKWRRQQALKKTMWLRPDLLRKAFLAKEEQDWLAAQGFDLKELTSPATDPPSDSPPNNETPH